MRQAVAEDPFEDALLEQTAGRRIRPSDFRGQKLVLFVCPPDDPGAYARLVEDFSACAQDFADCGTWLLALLVQDQRSSDLAQLFRSRHLPVTFDPDGSVAAALELWAEKGNGAQGRPGIEPAIYLLERDGTVCRVWKGRADAGAVLKAARAMP